MPSYEQLNDEPAWQDEYAPSGLKALALALETHWPAARCYVRGDNNHLRGYHRSRRWIQESIYCTNTTYSVSRTSGDRSGGDPNWSCALDLTGLSPDDLHGACQRLDEACRAGHLEKVTEWYGNLGEDGDVDGWDNISNRPASADSSHLTHLHMSFDRGRANDDHSDVLAILTGANMSEFAEGAIRYTDNRLRGFVEGKDVVEGNWENNLGAGDTIWPNIWIKQIAADVAVLKARPPVTSAPVDIAALVAALTPVIRAVVREELNNTKLGQL